MAKDKDFVEDHCIAEYYSLKLSSFHILEKLEICQDEINGTSLGLVLRATGHEDKRRLFMKFNSVVNLRLTPQPGTALSICQLEITPIKDLQWESVNYSVKEVEDDTLSFLCRDFSARIEE